MQNLYKEFFYVPKYGKIREKVMLVRVTMTVAIIVFCLAAMGFTAYAYFSHNISSTHNIIKSANFETNVKIQITTDGGEDVSVIPGDYKSHTAALKAETKYYITLTPTENSTAKTGFVILTAKNCAQRYHTQQLGKDGDGNTTSVTFYIIPSADTTVTFLSHWGTSCYYGYKDTVDERYITQGEAVQIPIVKSSDSQNMPAGLQPTPSTETVHIVSAGETLSAIAKIYDTTVARIADYNKIADINNIQIGQTLKIPPAEWAIPETAEPTAP